MNEHEGMNGCGRYKPFDVNYMPREIVHTVSPPGHPHSSTANVVSELHETIFQSD